MSSVNFFKIEKAKINHLEQVKEIELECGLSNWSPADYRQEIERTDSIFNVCEINDQIVGFILARLIMNKSTPSTILEKRIIILNTKSSFLNFESSYRDLKFNSEIESENESEIESENENEVEIYNIGIRTKYRRMCIGTYLLQSVLETSRQNSVKKIWLEVRISNKGAIEFYKAERFKITGTRRNLYTNPSEDGLIMCLNF